MAVISGTAREVAKTESQGTVSFPLARIALTRYQASVPGFTSICQEGVSEAGTCVTSLKLDSVGVIKSEAYTR